MSLNWYIGDIENFEELKTESGELHPVTNVLTFMTITTGMPEITKVNCNEFFTRTSMWEHAVGSMLINKNGDKNEERPLTLADIKRHIGLRTNATKKTPAQFHKTICDSLRRQAETDLRKQREQLQNEAERKQINESAKA